MLKTCAVAEQCITWHRMGPWGGFPDVCLALVSGVVKPFSLAEEGCFLDKRMFKQPLEAL